MNATEQTPWGTYPLDPDEVPSNQRHLLARQVRNLVLMGRMYRAFVAFCFLFSWLIAGALVVGIAYLINPEYLNGSYLVAFAAAYFFLRLAPPVMALRLIRKLREIGSDSPPGIKLKRDRAPKLFELIDEVVAKTKSRPIEGVCLIGEESLSAGVIKSKERGGRLQRYLTVPLPLLDVLSPEQFRAALTQSLLTCSDPHIDAVWQGRMECQIWFLLTYGLGAPTEITGFRTFGTRYYQQLFAMTNRLMRSIQRGATIQTGNLVSRQSMADAGIIQSGRLTYVTI